MDQSESYVPSFQAYQNFDGGASPNTHGFPPFYPSRASHYDVYGRPKESQEDLDLSPLDVLAQKSVDDVQLQDVIKPQESGPWSGAQTSSHSSGQSMTQSWPSNSVYAKSEPPLRQGEYYDYTDSGYGASNMSQLDSRMFQSADVLHNDNDSRSVFTDGHIQGNSRNVKRKHQIAQCHCGRVPKNPSDAKKHALTHEKPFRCRVNDCTRKDGFATENDLQRHRKSVHGLMPMVGSRVGYICAACPNSPGARGKFWPRRDNFKAHIIRKHKNLDIDHLLDASKQTMPPDDTITVGTFTESIAAESQIDPHEVSPYPMDMSPSLSRHASDQGLYQNSSWPSSSASNLPTDPLMGGMFGHLQYQNVSTQHSAGGNGGLSIPYNVPNEVQYTCSSIPNSPFKRQNLNAPNCQGQSHSEPLHTHDILGQYQPPSTNSGSIVAQAASSMTASTGEFECQYCHKKKRRDCDLKKHMKRHTRPYGCTFPACHGRYGSRNDWKRHESTQHFLHEMWKCGHKCKDGKTCMRRPFRRQESLEKHLRGPQHGMLDTNDILKACKEYRLGREGYYHFWCGFCGRLIEQRQGVQTAWDERFKHIGDHFDKNVLDIGEWICIDENIKKKYIRPNGSKEGRRRLRIEARAEEEHEDEEEGGLGVYAPETGSILRPSQHRMLAPWQGCAMSTPVFSHKRKREVDVSATAELYS